MEAPIASSLGSSAAFRPTRPRGGADYLGGMLRGGNLARAIVLSEILGPPKALE